MHKKQGIENPAKIDSTFDLKMCWYVALYLRIVLSYNEKPKIKDFFAYKENRVSTTNFTADDVDKCFNQIQILYTFFLMKISFSRSMLPYRKIREGIYRANLTHK